MCSAAAPPPRIAVSVLRPDSAELAVCAAWRIDQFADVLNTSLQAELASLQRFTADQTDEVALIAKVDGASAGTCLLVRSEIEPQHALTPWLAGLFVAPAHRRRGVGEALVAAIEQEARRRGHRELFLYTTGAADYYARLGWQVSDRLTWKGTATALMRRQLA